MKKIVIVGGGIIGLLSALVSAKHNHKVIILNERKPPPKIPYLERKFILFSSDATPLTNEKKTSGTTISLNKERNICPPVSRSPSTRYKFIGFV